MMKCPMIPGFNVDMEMVPAMKDIHNCIKEKCAWWDGELELCAILSIVQEIKWVGDMMDPH
jgi:hypothetical protein